MIALRLYNLYRRAGNSPCQAFRLAHRASLGAVESAACYAAAVLIAFGAALLLIWS